MDRSRLLSVRVERRIELVSWARQSVESKMPSGALKAVKVKTSESDGSLAGAGIAEGRMLW